MPQANSSEGTKLGFEPKKPVFGGCLPRFCTMPKVSGWNGRTNVEGEAERPTPPRPGCLERPSLLALSQLLLPVPSGGRRSAPAWSGCALHLLGSTPSAPNDTTNGKQVPRNCYCHSQQPEGSYAVVQATGGWLPRSYSWWHLEEGCKDCGSSPDPPSFLLLPMPCSSSLPTPPSLPARPRRGGRFSGTDGCLSSPSILSVN